MRHLLDNSRDDAIHYINSLLKSSKTNESNGTYWFLTPQNPVNGREYTPIQTRVLKELRELGKLERLNPQIDMNFGNQFLSAFNWMNSTWKPEAKEAV